VTPTITVVINTLNEERNLSYALRSVESWADQIVIVDMHSDDRTVAIARSFAAEVYLHERMGFVEPARAFGIAQAVGDWILLLDADELIPRQLSRELLDIAASDGADVVSIPMVNLLLGSPMRGAGWGPAQDRHIRFFRRGHLAMPTEIHGSMQPVEGSRRYEIQYRDGVAMIHFSSMNSAQFIEKLNRYTDVEAYQAHERGERHGDVRSIIAAAKEFSVRYFLRAGYRDGWRGLYLSIFMAFYRIAAGAKMHEIYSIGSRESVRRRYNQEAERLLAEYSRTPRRSDTGQL
jgi:glycosyltransferase involved in cell wall biosynthesis